MSSFAIFKIAEGQSIFKEEKNNEEADMEPFWEFYHAKLMKKRTLDIYGLAKKKNYGKGIHVPPIFDVMSLPDFLAAVAPKVQSQTKKSSKQ